MTWYLGITTTKKISPFPGADRERGEFAVQRQLSALGVTSHVPVSISFLRRGKRRYAEPVTEVLLPNYIFADIPADLHHLVRQVRGLVPTMMAVSSQSVERHVLPFIKAAKRKEDEANRLIEAKDRAAMCQFEPGDLLEILSGPFEGQVAKFTKMVQSAHDFHPMVGFEGEFFGGTVPGKIDPLSVRKVAV